MGKHISKYEAAKRKRRREVQMVLRRLKNSEDRAEAEFSLRKLPRAGERTGATPSLPPIHMNVVNW